jgi:uncharacterized membrane protein
VPGSRFSIPSWFVALGLLLGSAYAFFMAPLRVPDEGGHLYRTYLVSEGVCTGVPAIGGPLDYRELDQGVVWLQLPRTSTGGDLLKLVDEAHGRALPVVSLFYAVNLYSCLPYLPAGAAFRLGRIFTSSTLSLMYVGRFGNLLFYLLMVVAAMRLLPGYQAPIAILALMPMSLHQAASLSADAMTMGASFVLTAYILRLATTDDSIPLRRSDYLLLLAGMLLSGLCKSNAGLVFLLVLIPGTRFPDRRTRWLAITGYIVAAYAMAAAWQYIDRPNGEIYSTLKAAAGIHLDENAAVVLRHPTVFLSAVGRTVAAKGYEYLRQFVGKLGWLEIQLPGWTTWLYLALLAMVAAAYRVGTQLSRRQRILLLAIFLLNAASLLAAFWTTETPREFITSNQYVIPIFGRYLIPFALLPMVAVSGTATRIRGRWVVPSALAVMLLVNGIALRMVWNRYQAHSSTIPNRLRMALRLQFAGTPETLALRFQGLLVRRPGPGAEDGKVFLVRDGRKCWVLNGSWLTSHGYTWPDDVNFISAADLAAIPEGAPILQRD